MERWRKRTIVMLSINHPLNTTMIFSARDSRGGRRSSQGHIGEVAVCELVKETQRLSSWLGGGEEGASSQQLGTAVALKDSQWKTNIVEGAVGRRGESYRGGKIDYLLRREIGNRYDVVPNEVSRCSLLLVFCRYYRVRRRLHAQSHLIVKSYKVARSMGWSLRLGRDERVQESLE
eukprot:c34931_g1_i1 orf=269-796(+)